MNRKEAADLLPIIQAFAAGEDIEWSLKPCTIRGLEFHNGWLEMDDFSFSKDMVYRIKPKPGYRPFANAEECWNEMKKHQPFGVVKDKHFANYQTHRAFTFLTTEGCNFRGYEDMTFETSFKNLLFADGTPFGVKEEE